MTREEAFKKQLEEHKKRQEEEKNRENYTPPSYEDIKCAVIPRGKCGLYRLVGWPLVAKHDSTDPKEIAVVKAIDDNDKICYFNVPTRSEDSKHFYYRLWYKVMSYKTEGTTRAYTNEKLHPSIFYRVAKNNQKDNALEKGMKVQNSIAMNVIDCLGYDWHKEHKHTALLCKKMSKDGIVYPENKGIPQMAYDFILKVMETKGDWENYQIVMKSLRDKPYYEVGHAIKEKDDLKILQPDIVPYIEDRPTSEEELGWERYDLDKLFPISSYTKWLNRMGLFLQSVDKAFGTSFYEEVLAKSEEEKKGWELKKESTETEEKKEASVSRRTIPTEEKEANKEGFNILDYKDQFPYVDQLTQGEVSKITGVDESSKTFFTYSEVVLDCAKCSLEFPESFHICPKCGQEYTITSK
jgi:hypothetical protein